MKLRAAWLLAAGLSFAAGVAAPEAVAPRAALADDAAPSDPVAEAKKLAEEAKEYEKVAGDSDIDAAERKTARKNARERLKKARDLLDGYLDKHPEDTEKYDALYSDIQIRYYWIKKMSAVDELGPEPSPGPAPKPPGAGPTPGNGGGPAGPAPGTGPSPGTGPAPGPAPGTGPAPPPTKVEPPKPVTPTEAIGEIESYGSKHPGDVPGLCEKYQDFLARYPDSSTPEYAKAMAQVEALSKKMKDVYRLVHDDDPDSIKNVDSAQTEKLLTQLLEDLDKGVPEVRARAAKFLGALGSGKAADPLVKTLKKEKSGPVFDASADALARIGGKRVCDRLLKAGGDDALAPTIVGILEKILARGGAEGRVAGEALGGYVGAIAPENRGPIFEALSNAGVAGALGLARGLEFAPPDDVAKYVDKLPEAGDPRVVLYLAKLMIVNPPGIRAEHAGAARKAIEKIGKPGVRYLIPNLDDPTCAVWTAELLHRITGQKLKDDKRKTWENWFRQNRKSFEGK